MPQEDAKMVKKEEIEDEDDDKSLASAFAKRSKNLPHAATKSQARVKKEESKLKKEDEDDDFDSPASNKASSKKTPKKRKRNEQESEKAKKKGNAAGGKEVKKERKVFDLPGQRRDPPEERDPLRIFYESLYSQVPDSEMAAIWMMESGLLPKEVAKKVFERKQKKAQQQKLGSPMKTVATVKKKAVSVTIEKKSASSSVTVQKKKTPESKMKTTPKQLKSRKHQDGSSGNDSDDDFVHDTKISKKQRAS